MAQPVPSHMEGCDTSLPGHCARAARQVQEPRQSPPTEGPQARSQSPGGGVGQQHGHRRTTGSSPKYREPTPPLPGPGLRTGDGRDLSDLATEEGPVASHLSCSGGQRVLGSVGWGRGTPASAPRLALPPRKLYSHHTILGTSCLPFPSGGRAGGGLSDQGPEKERVT